VSGGFAATRAESLRLSDHFPILLAAMPLRRSLKNIKRQLRKAGGFPHGKRQSRPTPTQHSKPETRNLKLETRKPVSLNHHIHIKQSPPVERTSLL